MRWLFLSLIALYFKQCDGQQVQPAIVTTLPAVVNESSGLVAHSHDLFWTINDSGGEPLIYGFDQNGNLIDSIRIPNAINRDWESLTFDRVGERLFIGDFGNNSQSRKDLTIYWMNWSNDTLSGAAKQMTFDYPDQKYFPAADNFDAEGFFYWQDSLYLFSKNRTIGAKGYSKLYRLPVDTGHHTAVLMDSMLTQLPITGATINPAGDCIALLSYGSLMLLDIASSPTFVQGQLTRLGIPFSQTEAIDFLGNDTLYFTDEQGKLYVLDKTFITGFSAQEGSPLKLQPNPATNFIQVEWEGVQRKGKVTVFSTRGTIEHRQKVIHWPIQIAIDDWPQGTYYLQVEIDGLFHTLPFQKL